MSSSFSGLSDRDLEQLVVGLKTKRLRAIYSNFSVSQFVGSKHVDTVCEELNHLESIGLEAGQISVLIEHLLLDRKFQSRKYPSIDVVTTGPETPEMNTRDTALVVQELFKNAQSSVFLVGYAIYQGKEIFTHLADNMKKNDGLDVKFFLNIERGYNDKRLESEILSDYKQKFVNDHWPPECREPEVFYDPRALGKKKNSSLHAKCLVIDGTKVFVSSANFSHAGQERNIELGVTFISKSIASSIEAHFSGLVRNDKLQKLKFV